MCNAHDKTKIFMMISVWTNPTAIFTLIGARTTEQSQVKHELSFCARVLLGNIRRIFLLKNLGYWNAYYWIEMVIFIKLGRLYRAGTGYTVLPAVEGIILRMLRALKKNLYKNLRKRKKKVV